MHHDQCRFDLSYERELQSGLRAAALRSQNDDTSKVTQADLQADVLTSVMNTDVSWNGPATGEV
ncbi:MAG: hypothetical protein KDA72_05545 [Planctomycetales bacterium]|nr:hypothetical protein [Planctomycetales bacterium]